MPTRSRRMRFAPTWIAFLRTLVASREAFVTRRALREAAGAVISSRAFDRHFSQALRYGILQDREFRDGKFVPIGSRAAEARGRPQKLYRIDHAELLSTVATEVRSKGVRRRIAAIAERADELMYGEFADGLYKGVVREWIFISQEDRDHRLRWDEPEERIREQLPGAEDPKALKHQLMLLFSDVMDTAFALTWVLFGDEAMLVSGPALSFWAEAELVKKLDPIAHRKRMEEVQRILATPRKGVHP